MEGLYTEEKEVEVLKIKNAELEKENERLKGIVKNVLELISNTTNEGGMSIE